MPAKNKIQIEIEVTSNGEILLKTADGVEQFGKRAEEAAKGSKILDGAMERIGQKATDLVAQLPAMIVDLGKLGVQSEAVAFRFEKFAGSEERATALLGAFVDATDNTINKMDAMAGAGRLLQMGLVSNADEMAAVAAISTKLGDQTQSAGDRVADFAALLANQSIPRLDNFGISSGRVRNRIKELQAATKDMSREEAFKIAVMEEGRKSLDTLGDSTELTKVKLDKLTAALDDAKIGVGEMIAEVALGSVEVDGLAERIRLLPETINQIGIITGGFTEMIEPVSKVGKFIFDWLTPIGLVMQGVGVLGKGLKNAFDAATPAIAKALAGTDAVRKAVEKTIPPTEDLEDIVQDSAASWDDYQRAVSRVDLVVDDSQSSFDQYAMAILESQDAMDDAAISAVDFAQEQAAVQAALTKTESFLLDQGIAWTDFNRDREEQQADAAEALADIEQEHQDNIAEITERGQARSFRIDTDAEQLSLQILEATLAEKIAKQSEFDEETSELTKLRTEQEIGKLQGEIASKNTLLASAHEGWITSQGENITTMLAAEEERYASDIALQEEAQAAQEESQRLSLGRQVLQTFEAWAAQKGIAAADMLEMRTAISLEYGLIDEETALTTGAMVDAWELWAENTDLSATDIVNSVDSIVENMGNIPTEVDASITWDNIVADSAITQAGNIKTAIDAIPNEKNVTVRVRTEGVRGGEREALTSLGVPAEALGLQQGADFVVPAGFEDDSFGPIFVSSGERVTVVPQDTTNNFFNQTINSRASTEQSSGGFRMMQSMIAGQ